MAKQQKGFTLIELVLVIVILGILAATALPRFSDLSTEARSAAVNGMAGGMRGALAIAHATALARGNTANQNVTLEGQAVTMANFYPTADDAGITAALADVSGFTSDNAGLYTKDGAPTPATCSVTYLAAPANGSPTVTPATGGC